jgi:hypothetical protein
MKRGRTSFERHRNAPDVRRDAPLSQLCAERDANIAFRANHLVRVQCHGGRSYGDPGRAPVLREQRDALPEVAESVADFLMLVVLTAAGSAAFSWPVGGPWTTE